MDLMAFTDPEFPTEIPELLVQMRAVQEFPIEPPACPRDQVSLRGLRNMWADNFLKFRESLERQEADWLAYKTAKLVPVTAPSEWKGEGPCPVCKREASEPVEDLEQWKLEELIEGLSETK